VSHAPFICFEYSVFFFFLIKKRNKKNQGKTMLRRFPGALRKLKIKDEDNAACYEEIQKALVFSLAVIKEVIVFIRRKKGA
jgi:hypothetical protein